MGILVVLFLSDAHLIHNLHHLIEIKIPMPDTFSLPPFPLSQVLLPVRVQLLNLLLVNFNQSTALDVLVLQELDLLLLLVVLPFEQLYLQ
jgi:hypothetical protein